MGMFSSIMPKMSVSRNTKKNDVVVMENPDVVVIENPDVVVMENPDVDVMENPNVDVMEKPEYYLPSRINKEIKKPLIHQYIVKFNRFNKKPVKFHISAYSPRNAYEQLVYKYSFKLNPILYNYKDATIREKNIKTMV